MNNFTTTSNGPLSEPTHSRASRATLFLTTLIGWYQYLRGGRVAPCRFLPSCSNYAVEALAVHGASKGSWLALRRVFRCRPLGPHGIDLVPEMKLARRPPS